MLGLGLHGDNEFGLIIEGIHMLVGMMEAGLGMSSWRETRQVPDA